LNGVVEPERHTPLFGEFDVVVLGGGPAGIAAAVSAARHGASTLLVERYGFLGGMGTAAGVTNFCGLHANVHGEHRRVVHGVVDELLDRIHALDGLSPPHLVLGRIHAQAYDAPAYKCAADALLAESGARVLFHAVAAGVSAFPSGIDCLLVETKSGRRAIRGLAFVDCSGDGDLAAWSGAPVEKGDASGALLYPTLMFRVGGIDDARAGEAWRSIPALMDEAERSGEFRFPRKGAIVRPQKHDGEWRVNVTQLRNADGTAVDGTDAAALSAAEAEGRRQAVEYLRFLRAKAAGFERAYILELAPQVGIRETRRLAGLYQLTREDVLGCADFDDGIGVNGWPVENHVAGDVRWEWPAEGSRGYNQLPMRMLVPREGPPNLLVAGRCASMTHEGQSAARVSGACFVMGQAAGTAAAFAMRGDIAPRDVPYLELRAGLERDGAFLG
jgi:hypothetical protein